MPSAFDAFAGIGDAIGGEQARQFDAQLSLRKREIDNTYKVAMMNARTAQDVAKANAWYQRAQIDLAKERLGFDREQFTKEFGERVREFDVGATGYLDRGGRMYQTFPREQFETSATGMYEGRPTMQRQAQEAGISGYYYPGAKLNAAEEERWNMIQGWLAELRLQGKDQDALDPRTRDELAMYRRKLSGEGQEARPTFEREMFGAQMGARMMEQLAQLRGPANYFQAAEYARGMSETPGTSSFLAALQNNARLPGFGAQGGLPQKEDLGTLSAKLTGTSGLSAAGASDLQDPGFRYWATQRGDDPNDPRNMAVYRSLRPEQIQEYTALSGGGGTSSPRFGPQDSAYMAQLANIAAKGAHQLSPGALEQMTPTERALFGSGLDALGIDTSTFLSQYQRSRLNQGFGSTGQA